jgi:hypothetical protein
MFGLHIEDKKRATGHAAPHNVSRIGICAPFDYNATYAELVRPVDLS